MHIIKQDLNKVRNMDLLWRYYEKSRNFGKAAHVLARLADMHRYDEIKHTHTHTHTHKDASLQGYVNNRQHADAGFK